jgi:exopolysaccharide biosynthesis polyprenyl glycosylphosphotransferase
MIAVRWISWAWNANFRPRVCFLGGDKFCADVAQLVDDHPIAIDVLPLNDVRVDFVEWAIDHRVDEVVYETANASNEAALLHCLDTGVRVSSYADFVEEKYGRIPVEQIDASWLFSSRLDIAHPYYLGLKRLVDVAISSLALVVGWPVVMAAALAIRLESPGQAFYSQTRVGRFNRHFRIYKLRTMVIDSEKDGPQWATNRDPRITRVGAFLRKTRLDELPQLWNVLKGEMALVGPRPERPEFVETLSQSVPFYRQRHLVKPGLTGWAQINYPYGANVRDACNKLTYDFYYIKNASLALDLQIMLRTFGALMKGSR